MVAIALSLPNGTTHNLSHGSTHNLSSDVVINLDHGDPTVFEPYWEKMGDKCTATVSGHQLMSYFSDRGNMCWFLEPELASSIRRVHGAVRNSVVSEDRFLVVGTGSTQLTQALFYALSSPLDGRVPVSVVCAAPYYSAYPSESDYLRSSLYKWGGDAGTFAEDVSYIEIVTSPNNPDETMREAVVKKEGGFVVHDLAYYWPQYTPITAPANHDIMLFTFSKWGGDARTFAEDGSYIEIVTSLNNPDGTMREVVVKKEGGFVVHDLAYYWPQYTPITAPANHNIMLFTFSKCTGHAGSRIGWALVKNEGVAAGRIKFMECNSIGVSRESQLRAAKILKHISHNCIRHDPYNFFEFGRSIMLKRWERLREVAKGSNMFNLPKYPTQRCQFTEEVAKSHTGFAWLECKEGRDLESVFREHMIVTRGGARFGCNNKYVRVSLLCKDLEFEHFMERLSTICSKVSRSNGKHT